VADVLIGLGGNVGDARLSFARAIPAICSGANAALHARSSDYRTPPWGEPDQPPFINACIAIETPLAPGDLLAVLHAVEREFGRDRASETRWGPRTLDLDILAYDDQRIDLPGLTIPHPRWFERAFVLVPLAEIAPDRAIQGQTPRQALAKIVATGITRLPALA
jgi:2-amino-4-hydroxy-6-hydroxymethyldihydropteridine diphosphokinase